MTTILKSGESDDLLTIDPTSKAARAILSDETGLLLSDRPLYGRFTTGFTTTNITITADTILFGMWNTTNSGMTVRIRKLVPHFNGHTPSASGAETNRLSLYRFRSLNAFTGGTALVPAPKGGSSIATGASRLNDIRWHTAALTNPSSGFARADTPFMDVACLVRPSSAATRYPGMNAVVPFRRVRRRNSWLEDFSMLDIDPGEGIFMEYQGGGVGYGKTLGLMLEWDEVAA